MNHCPYCLYVTVCKWHNKVWYKRGAIIPVLIVSLLGHIGVFIWLCSLAPLVKKVSEARVVEMANKLCDKLLNGKDQHRDIASIALKTIVAEVVTQSLAQSILVAVTPQLIKGITGPVSSWNLNWI